MKILKSLTYFIPVFNSRRIGKIDRSWTLRAGPWCAFVRRVDPAIGKSFEVGVSRLRGTTLKDSTFDTWEVYGAVQHSHVPSRSVEDPARIPEPHVHVF